DNGSKKEYGYSRKNGSFSIPIETGNYNLEVESNNNYWTSCIKSIASASYNYNDTLDLGLQINTVCPFLSVDIQPGILRRCFETILYVKYTNTGTVKADKAYVDVTLDPFFDFISSSIPFSSKTGNVYRFLLGDVDENTKGSF